MRNTAALLAVLALARAAAWAGVETLPPLADGVFIQQEHEGSLAAPAAIDARGDVFAYYQPVELRPALLEQARASLPAASRAVVAAKTLLSPRTPRALWRALPLPGKLAYLEAFEKAVVSERGAGAAWDGKESRVLERVAGAPDFIAANAHMEAPPDSLNDRPGARFLQPEIVTHRDLPARSVEEAIARAQRVIQDTGHAGVQFHVFVKAPPQRLLAQSEAIEGALQKLNDSLFARAVQAAAANIAHPSLLPWHAGRSARVRELLTRANASAHQPSAEDPDSEKHAFVGFRYWGLEEGQAVVSFELRGVSVPLTRSARVIAVEGAQDNPRRDYSEARRELYSLAAFASAVARGEASASPAPRVVLDERAADASLSAKAAGLGLPFDGLAALSRRLSGAAKTPQGYLFPFAADPGSPALEAFAEETVVLAARAKAAEEAGRPDALAHLSYLFWAAYGRWARDWDARRRAS